MLTAAGRDFLARIQRPLADIEEAYRSVLDLSAAKRGSERDKWGQTRLIGLDALRPTFRQRRRPAFGQAFYFRLEFLATQRPPLVRACANRIDGLHIHRTLHQRTIRSLAFIFFPCKTAV